jgi:hypothetical protein
MKYIQSFYQYPVTFSSIGKTIPARSAQGEMKNIAEVSEKELEKLNNAEPFFRELVNKKKVRVLNHIPASYVPPAQQINQAHDEAEKYKTENEALKARIAELEAKAAEKTEETASAAGIEDKDDDLKALSYDDLKARAAELGIEFKANVKKADLIKMIEEAQTKAE